MTPQPNILQQCRREADEIQWKRFDELLNPRRPKGSQEAFTAVILDHCKPKPVAPQNNLHLNGGGMKQLKHDAIELALSETGSITKAAAKLKVNRGVLYDYFRRKVALGVLSLFVLSLVSGAFAQRGTGSNPAATTTTLSSFSLAPAPFKQTMLTWDNPPGASNVVAWGTVRNYWTNGSRTITTNVFPITNGTAYKVTAIVDGVESVPALWPSNRIGELWLTGLAALSPTQPQGIGTNIVRLVKFTNTPPGNMQFWGVANITTGWE